MLSRTRNVGGQPSSWRPPWFDTNMASAPFSTASRASSGHMIPLTHIGSLVERFRNSRASQVKEASTCKSLSVLLGRPVRGLRRIPYLICLPVYHHFGYHFPVMYDSAQRGGHRCGAQIQSSHPGMSRSWPDSSEPASERRCGFRIVCAQRTGCLRSGRWLYTRSLLLQLVNLRTCSFYG